MPSIYKPQNLQFEKRDSPIPEYSWESTEDLAASAGMADFTFNIRKLGKGKYSYPYHFHHNSNELFIILSGRGELRTSGGIRSLEKGEIVLFERGETGAHQLYNPNEEELVYLDLRSLNKVDVCEYPDTGKVNILPQREIFRRGADADYFEGEENIGKVWSKL